MNTASVTRVRRRLLAPMLAGALLLLTAPSAGAVPVPPTQDSFYVYSAGAPLASYAPGAVLKTRHIAVQISGKPTPYTGTQLLYRTTDELGKPSVTVTTVIAPPIAKVPVGAGVRLVSYQTAYDALGTQCDPSYTLAGGNSGYQLAQDEALFISTYLDAGYYVNVPDYQGTPTNGRPLHWAAGHESGYGTLDSIRAAETSLQVPSTTKVGLVGYSGGSIASEWASELAPTYSKQLNIVGVAEAGIPVDFAHNLVYINGTPVWSGVIPAVIVSLSTAFGVNYTQYLSAYGVKVTNAVKSQCITDFLGTYPGLTVEKLLKPQYRKFLQIPAFVKIINSLIMGTAPGHPKGPLFMMNGIHDGTGDDVMIADDVQALAHEYCRQGVNVNFVKFSNSQATHTNTAAVFAPAALSFLTKAFTATPMPSGCARIGPGNSLAPLPAAQAVSTASSTPTSSAPPAPASVTPQQARTAPRGAELAATGPDTARIALVGLDLTALGLVLVCAAWRRRPISGAARGE